jgi:hypothetical protein
MPDLLLDIRLRWRKVRTLIMLIMDAGAYRARSAGGALRKGRGRRLKRVPPTRTHAAQGAQARSSLTGRGMRVGGYGRLPRGCVDGGEKAYQFGGLK